ncbi:MAG: ferritin-like domain-containing protein, partial [Chloroflexota bacterium]
GGVATSKPYVPAESGIKKQQSIPELLQNDIGLESDAIHLYNDLAKVCADEGDHVSKQLFEKIAGQEEGHLDEFQNINDFVDKLGAPYLASLTGESAG